VIIRELCLAVVEGKQQRQGVPQAGGRDEAGAADQPRRSRRAQFRADDSGGKPGDETPLAPEPAVAAKVG
jgi:hypothetical protein